MSKAIWIVALVVLIAMGAAYFFFVGKEYQVILTEEQIREKLEARLPITKRYFLIIELTLSNPRVDLENGSNRVLAGLDAVLNIKINNNPIPLGGTVDASAGVTYVPEEGQFFLVDPVVENLGIQGIPAKWQTKVNEAASKALAEYFEVNPIYTLKRANLKQAAARAVLKNVVVENNQLVITLGI